MSYQYNCDEGYNNFRQSQEKRKAIKRNCGHNCSSKSLLSIDFY